MITEDYVSFETAKLLKEKGFDVKCDKCYAYFADDDIRFLNLKYPKSSQLLIEDRYPCITLQMAKKWLREVHDIYYEVKLLLGDKAVKYGDLQLGVYQLSISGAYRWEHWLYADTYEELYEKYIKYCLENLIK